MPTATEAEGIVAEMRKPNAEVQVPISPSPKIRIESTEDVTDSVDASAEAAGV